MNVKRYLSGIFLFMGNQKLRKHLKIQSFVIQQIHQKDRCVLNELQNISQYYRIENISQ